MQKAARAILLLAPMSLIIFCNFPPEPERVIQRPFNMKLIPGGTFLMGANYIDTNSEYDLNAKPQHPVTLDSFYMDSTEVTQQLYYDYIEHNPALNASLKFPVENVSWFDAVLFCNARSKREHYHLDTVYSYSAAYFRVIATGKSCSLLTNVSIDYSKKGYRLPTEAEWEYACRAGTAPEFYWFWGSSETQGTVDGYAWFVYNAGRKTHQVALKKVNPWGLYDIIGNVSEWCNDWYEKGYSPEPAVNPVGPATGTMHIVRGGSMDGNCTTGSLNRSATRKSEIPERCGAIWGFRCVLPRK